MLSATPSTALAGARDAARRIAVRYAAGQDRPLGGYVAALATYSVGGAALLAAAARRTPTGRLPAQDLLLVTVATQRIARTLTKDAVTSPLRAPFARFDGAGLPSEVTEQVDPQVARTGHRHAVAELLTCPFCMAQWTATGLVAGHVLAPRFTRLLTATFAAVAGADALQYAYAALAGTQKH